MTSLAADPRTVPARRAVLGQLPPMRRPDGTPIRVLVVDDERALTNLVTMILRSEGWEVDVAHDGETALSTFETGTHDLVILDVMLPDLDGLQILERMRAAAPSYTPVLFLTARDSVPDRVAGLTAGGDDYMTKPFSIEELVARSRGLLRRLGETSRPEDETLRVGDLVLNGASREVTRDGERIELTATEFELLRYLMQNPRRALSRDQILKDVWKYTFDAKTSIVDLYISYLRKKIDAGREAMIHTVRGVGYQLRPA
jgi:two-component system response regulator TrcR